MVPLIGHIFAIFRKPSNKAVDANGRNIIRQRRIFREIYIQKQFISQNSRLSFVAETSYSIFSFSDMSDKGMEKKLREKFSFHSFLDGYGNTTWNVFRVFVWVLSNNPSHLIHNLASKQSRLNGLELFHIFVHVFVTTFSMFLEQHFLSGILETFPIGYNQWAEKISAASALPLSI